MEKSHRIGEEQQMLSVRVCDATKKRFNNNNPFTLHNNKPVLIEYDVPIKKDGNKKCEKNCTVLNWPAMSNVQLGNTGLEIAGRFIEFGRYDDHDKGVREKYDNTAQFIKHCTE